MTPERWQQIRDVLERALELAAGERSTYLNQACASDSSLRQEVETLLASSPDVRSSFLQSATLRVTLTSGTKFGDYEVKSLLGSGGMGEVYRARDLRLGRDVAIKVLPSFLSADTDRLRRFEQEARAAAALNHPNILAVHQMGTHEGAPYLVSELLEGETLREPIKRGRLAVRKAIDYGVQIARGLAAAHEKGIVHRDLKPENLFLTKDGRVKILDFGLAKLTQPQPGSEHDAPTVTEGTEAGVVMGTVGYMSPEQVRGQTVDHRTDVFAFGAILYEMLAGKRAFQKSTSADTMSAILNEDPLGISQVTANIPPALQRVVHRCLEKSPEQRFQSASDLAFALDALSEASSNTSALSNKQFWKMSKLWAVAAVLAAVVAVVFVLLFRNPWRPEPKHELVVRQLTATPPESTISAETISRDGKYLAYGDFSNKLYLLAIDSGEIREAPLPAPYQPADWFPDGNHLLLIGGLNGGDLWKISTWDFSVRKLWGGPASEAALSPDGSHIGFVKDFREVWLMGAEGEEPQQIFASDAETLFGLAWSPTGQRLAYIRTQGTFAKPEFTIETCDLAGGAHTVVLSDPRLSNIDAQYGLAWLPDGRIIYSIYSKGTDRELWAISADTGTGKQIGDATRVASWENFQALFPQASADGRRLIAARQHAQSEVYVGGLGPGAFTPRRVTLDDWYNDVTAWTKDSKAIFFQSKRNGKWAIFKQEIDAKAPETLIAGSENYLYPRLSAQGDLIYTARSLSSPITYRLMRTPEHGGARSTLLMGRYTYACGSSPSSSCVLAELNDKKLTFFNLNPVTGRGEEIASIAGYQSPEPRWDLSPDGSRIVIVDPTEEKGEIRILNVADRKTTVQLVRDWKWQFLSQIAWAADGKSWFALAQSSSSYALMSIDANGNPKVLQAIPAGVAWVPSIVPSPDGRSLAFTKRMFIDDVMLLENF
jgi:eukaryotic-like serine/threonine-protein kinase